jgi:GPH family glycoside/pentoside/hexuronide:cation symporter
MWWIPKGDTVRTWFPTEAGYKWFQLLYILVTLTLFFTSVTLFEIPHSALGAEMTTDSHQRTRLFSAKSFVGNLFAMSTPWLFVLANLEVFKGPRGNEADGMRYVSLMVAAILVPLSFWWFFTLREPGFKQAARQEATPFWQSMKRTVGNANFIRLTLTIFTLAMGFNFVQLLGSYIPIFYVFGGDKAAGAKLLGINGTVWAVTGLLAVFPLDWIGRHLGKRSTLTIAILLIATAQLSKVVCYNPARPYLIVIPTILLSCGMLFFFTLGSSMVGDICDEDELETGVRAEGAFYSVFWWFIKMGTALASLISGALILLTMFDETQVTKVDKLQGDVRDIRAAVVSAHTQPSAAAASTLETQLAEKLEVAKVDSAALHTYLQRKATDASKGGEHYRLLAQKTEEIGTRLSSMSAPGAAKHFDALDAELTKVEATLVELTRQQPYTLLMMRVVEIGLPLLACFFSLLFLRRYALTEKRTLEIKELLAQRHAASAAPAAT